MQLLKLIKEAKEKPDKEPIICDKHPDPFHPNPLNMVRNKITHRAYKFLKENPDKAFTAPEISRKLRIRVQYTTLNNIVKKGFIFKSKFKVPTGRTFNAMGYLFSFSEKSIWKRITETIPKPVKQALFIIFKNPNMIFSIKDLQDLCGIEYSDKYTWFDKIFIKSFKKAFNEPMLQKRMIRGLRTFYYSPAMTDEKFQEVYKRYYQKNILSQESLSKLKGQYFEEFATWTFCEYMKIKGLNLELKKVDREPCDFIANIKINIGDLIKIIVNHIEHIANGKIVSVEVKKLGEVKDEDLVGESPDAITKDLLIKGLNEIYSKQLKRNVRDDDIVTIIKWKYI